jgi:hypothetical protein
VVGDENGRRERQAQNEELANEAEQPQGELLEDS